MDKAKIRCQSASTRKMFSNTQTGFPVSYNPIISANNINKDIVNINNLNLQISVKKFAV